MNAHVIDDFWIVYRRSWVNIRKGILLMQNISFREKILRLFQYFLKFYSAFLKKKNGNPVWIQRLQLIVQTVGLHRKVFTLGSWLVEIQKIYDSFSINKIELSKLIYHLRQLILVAFFFLDNIVYLCSITLVNLDLHKIKLSSLRFILFAAFLQMIYNYMKIVQQIYDTKKEPGQQNSLNRKINKSCFFLLIKSMLDITTYMNATRIVSINDSSIGIIGSLSSLCALSSIWIDSH